MVDRYAGEKLDCDIVMKGGITSGVVYPGAIAKLAEHYRFRAIGGTSAGAIAAAILAAAEYRRQNPKAREPTAGFVQVEKLPATLGEEEGGELRLMRLFQPDKATRGLFRVLKGFLKHGKFGIPRIWLALPLFPLIGAALIALCVVLRHGGDVGTAVAWIGFVTGGLMVVVGPFVQIGRSVVRLPANFYGLCTLGPKSVGKGAALTEWLHEQIQAAAGRKPGDAVLTFADLWGIDPKLTDIDQRMRAMLAPSADPALRTIDLQMMTTDLTHGRPRRLPSGYHEDDGDIRLDDGGGLVFDIAELERFFPPEVITHMERCCKPISIKRRGTFPEKTWRRFPMGPDLPVVVATRMSLSFPVLIAAVPLWDVDYEPPGEPRKRVMFSDGGITSNFPVHFFDTALPRRPTFGLNLTTLPRDIPIPEGVEHQASAVREPPRASGKALEDPRDIEKLGQFLTAIKDAMQNWRDNLQAAQPGFRDRMVPVMLGKGEGGMTLNMSDKKILDLSARGCVAGTYLVQRFAVDSKAADTPWNEHRFGRFRITMAVTEQFMKDFERAYVDPPAAPGIGMPTRRITMSYAMRVSGATGKPYKMSAAQRAGAPVIAQKYCATLPSAAGTAQLADGAPLPRSVLRPVPPT
jgi:predicted acylesterase/phospholipase RssA